MIKFSRKKKIIIFSLASLFVLCLLLSVVLSKTGESTPKTSRLANWTEQESDSLIIPKPVHYTAIPGNYTLTDSAFIYVNGNNKKETAEIYAIGQYLADILNPSTGYNLSVVKSSKPTTGSIYLTTKQGDSNLGNEGYYLDVTTEGVTLSAFTTEGLFRGIQTIRQMLPADIEKSDVVAGVSWNMPCSNIADYPAYPWRGMMLDVARHFFSVEDVKRTIDLMAQYKMNKFHLHLTDDQGWRIEIKSWPDLTKIGGRSEMDGGEGGFYTQEEYIDIVNYAKARYITVIPEIDVPGHCNAALASYGELNPDGVKKDFYTEKGVGFSTLMCRSEITYTFLDDVIKELAAITPGEYIHVGGDEAASTKAVDYKYFIGRINEIVSSYGKTAIGWNPFDKPDTSPSTALLQDWRSNSESAQDKGMKIIMSPAEKAYLDMQYDRDTPIGLNWAGFSTTDDAYQWDPTDFAPKEFILGVECPLWTETIDSMDDIEYLAFPRLLGHAEVGWTPKDLRDWEEYKVRLQSQGPRMENQEIDFYRDPVVPW